MKKYYKYLLSIGHLATDINQGALPAILPFLILYHDLTYTSAASLILAANLFSSVIQPISGYLGDKISRPYLMSVGIILAGGGIAVIGFCESFHLVFIAAAISGMGVALFHPEGAKLANYVSGDKKSSAIGIFSVGGNSGFVLGPMVATLALSLWGMKGTAVFIIPAATMAVVLLFFTSKFRELTPKRVPKAEQTQKEDWGSFAKVSSIVLFRAILSHSLLTFIPLYFIGIFFLSKTAANTNLTLFAISGVVATVLGGQIADRIGYVRIVRICFFAIAPLIFMMLQMDTPMMAALFVIPLGFAINGALSTLIAMGQSFLPNRVGFASGITLGLAMSVGGMCAPLIGWVGDNFGLVAAMYTITGVACVAMVMTMVLPKVK